MTIPTLETARLRLRPFDVADAPAVQALAGAREVARNTLMIPHPYPDGVAGEWIATHEQLVASEREVDMAIVLRESGELIGAIGLILKREHDTGEIGYWIGVPYWGRGYATEAAGAVIDYGFRVWSLNRIEAYHFSRNPASGRVMVKNGMRHEGTLRQRHKKWGEYLDDEVYAILRSEWESRSYGSRTP
ncbi:MAG TPA: GNAT family N-acetyltransferase [Thermoanaerobaculia bacterium]|nr:GNAT family N-acetyltransferase [Thermoanaerobaculia bacterium]